MLAAEDRDEIAHVINLHGHLGDTGQFERMDEIFAADVLSKFIGLRTDGSVGSGTYEDTLERRMDGWRIAGRVVRARRVPLQP